MQLHGDFMGVGVCGCGLYTPPSGDFDVPAEVPLTTIKLEVWSHPVPDAVGLLSSKTP